ncbi:uncharacterized protein LOC125673062 isoform X2 [Ostrea edulis]|uniref:uncharacterized protein LOC125673062 isoform X2 n=1 Tax=Ostrea edulis TaxID=37623 RepID=UPI0024AF7A1B|nr:uncharacterized protein LOC125673062 isoform X2 [Ostrea edulis]XP_056014559.1 uncharacterized protein LOC125673062 isoform X2 [Ostrea edulis]XP_056014560.1 uncharacterized protein LOC125673062 isoform X2 [Ostrea edulis]
MSPGGGDYVNLMDIPRRDGEMNDEEERQREVGLFQERINKGGKPLNIAFIGAAGSGKSSLCNSIMAAFSVGCWRERATVGYFGGLAEQVTHHLLSFPKVEYLDFDALYVYNFPTLVDMNGFENSSDELTEELLRIVFYGRLPEEGKLIDAVKLAKKKGIVGLREYYSQNQENLKVDRIIFVASARTVLPTSLMEAVRNTARKEGRVIPIFGVLTHRDEVDTGDVEYMKLETEFRHGLGLPENRFLLCTTYCDAYDKYVGKSRLDHKHPGLDIPILKFMRQVCDTASRVIKDRTTYNEERQTPSSTTKPPAEDTKPPADTTKPPADDRQTKESEARRREDLKLMMYMMGAVIIAVFGCFYLLLLRLSGQTLT